MGAQQFEGQGHLVAEIDSILGPQQSFVGGVARGQLALTRGLLGQGRVIRFGIGRCLQPLGGGGVRHGTDVLVPRPAEQGGQPGQEAGRVPQRAESVQRQLEQVVAEEHDLLGPRQDSGRGPTGRPRRRGSGSRRSPKAWKVEMTESVKPYGTRRSTRSCISSAARSVKVRARISDGRARCSAISQAMRRVSTVVLPVPAPATTSSGPVPWVTALRWLGVRSASSGGWTRRCRGFRRGGEAVSSSKSGI